MPTLDPERKRYTSKIWYQNNVGRLKQKRKKWGENNKTHLREYSLKRHREFTPEQREAYRAKQKAWHLANKEYTKNRRLLRTYGITLAEHTHQIEIRKSKCDGCKRVKKLVIDHDHNTGKLRGLLCNSCNRLLGVLNDDLSTLKRLVSYLENPPMESLNACS